MKLPSWYVGKRKVIVKFFSLFLSLYLFLSLFALRLSVRAVVPTVEVKEYGSGCSGGGGGGGDGDGTTRRIEGEGVKRKD